MVVGALPVDAHSTRNAGAAVVVAGAAGKVGEAGDGAGIVVEVDAGHQLAEATAEVVHRWRGGYDSRPEHPSLCSPPFG